MNEIMNIQGIPCYEKDGVAYLNLETVARGLGFTQEKNGVEYVKWERVKGYLEELKFSPQVGKDDYIPENILLSPCDEGEERNGGAVSGVDRGRSRSGRSARRAATSRASRR